MSKRSRVDGGVAVLIGGALLALYLTTLAPGLAYQGGDGHELTVVAATLGLAHPTGYPLYTWVGHLFTWLPLGEVAYRTNLMSAVFGAGGVAMLFLVARRLGLPRGVAMWTAALFDVTTTFWSQAVITEVYAPNAFMLALALWLALRWADAAREPGMAAKADRRFLVFVLVYGSSLGTHMSNMGFTPFYALFVLLTDWRIVTRPRTLLFAMVVFALTMAQFAWLPLRARVVDIFPNPPPDSVAMFLAYTVRAFSNLRFAFPLAALPARVVTYLALLAQNFTVVGVVLGLAGMWVLLRRNAVRFWLLMGMYGVHVVVFSQQFVPDPDAFFIASNALFALFIGFGADAFLRTLERGAGPMARVLHVTTVLFLCLTLATIAHASYRENDRSADTGIADFHESVFDYLPSGSVLVPKGRGAFGSGVIYWRRIRHARPDIVALTDPDARVPPGAPMFVERTRNPAGFQLPKAMLVPVLRAFEHDLVLYRVEPGPSDPTEAPPEPSGVEEDLRVASLVRLDVRRVPGDGPPRVRVRAGWRAGDGLRLPIVSTSIDGVMLEAHELGGGTLGVGTDVRAIRAAGRIIIDEYQLVLPSTLATGSHALTVGTVALGPGEVMLHPAPAVAVVIE